MPSPFVFHTIDAAIRIKNGLAIKITLADVCQEIGRSA
jgi:hypothetical protein